MFALECHAAAELAAAEIDAAGGVAGRSVSFVHVDAGRAPQQVADEINALIADHRIDAVSGWHLSNTRRSIATATAGRIPYVYATAYEGGERTDGVLCSGEVSGAQLIASLRWFREHRGIRRWSIVGNDYVWPRHTVATTRDALGNTDISITGATFVPLGLADDTRWARTITEVCADDTQGVITLLVGADAVRFNRAFAARSGQASITRFSPFTDETVVLASGPDATDDLYVSAGWFAGLHGASAEDFIAGFRRAFHLLNGAGPGDPADTPPPGTMAETTYSAMHVLAGIAGSALPTVAHARRANDSYGWDSPHGPVDLRGGVAQHPVHLARADGVDLTVIDRVI